MTEKFITSDKINYYPEAVSAWLHTKHRELITPITVELHLSNVCNHNCYYCFAEKQKDLKIMTRNDAFDVIRKLREMKVKGLIFSGGGEPTLSPHFVHVSNFASINGIKQGLITNGDFKKDLIETIVSNFSWVRFSLDTVISQNYAKIRGVSEDRLFVVFDNLKKLVELKKKSKSNVTIGAQTVVTEDNVDDLATTYLALIEAGVDYYQIRPLENHIYSKKLWNKIQRAIWDLRDISNIKGKNTFLIESGKWKIINPYSDLKDRGYNECHCYPFIGAISAHGKIYICCHFVGDERFCYGDVIKDSVEELLRKREVVAKNIDLKKCPLACRGNQINIRLEGLKRGCEHQEFL